MKSFSFGLLALFLITITSCSEEDFIGSDNIVNVVREVPSFSKIVVQDVVRVNVIQAAVQQVEVAVNDNLLNQLRTNVQDNTLIISMENGSYDNASFQVNIQLPDLDRLQLDDATKGTLNFNLDQLEIEVNGSSDLQLMGTAQNLIIRNNDAGDIRGFDFFTDVLNITARDASETEITCDQELNGSVRDAAAVRYKGNPTINANISDAGAITDRN